MVWKVLILFASLWIIGQVGNFILEVSSEDLGQSKVGSEDLMQLKVGSEEVGSEDLMQSKVGSEIRRKNGPSYTY